MIQLLKNKNKKSLVCDPSSDRPLGYNPGH
jgi:hypothetical protein